MPRSIFVYKSNTSSSFGMKSKSGVLKLAKKRMRYGNAIAWLNAEDYERAGLMMLPAVAGGRRITGWQMTNYCLALLPVSLAPAVLEIAGRAYFLGDSENLVDRQALLALQPVAQ